MAGAEFAIRLLGPIELRRQGAAISAGGPTQRAVLAMLALHAGESIPLETLSEGVWGEGGEPRGAAKAMQVHIARMRRVVRHGGTQPIESVPGGYRLDLTEVSVDSFLFERELAEGRRRLRAGELGAAADTLAAALGRWRGPALMDVRDFPFAALAAARYDELRVDAAEEHFAALLDLGEAPDLVPQLHELIAANPYRERLYSQLMTALYRCGQQAAALDTYAAARSRLVLDLGLDPGPELQQLQQQILVQDQTLARPASAPPVVAPGEPRIPSRALPPARLPAETHLLGREALLVELTELAATERLITLTGAGGVGKTVLAVALAHRLADGYPDGAAFVDLAALHRPNQVLPALASALATSSQDRSLSDQLVDVLGEQRRLIVLDNCEHLLPAVSDLTPLLDVTAGLVIATSRNPLGLRAEHLVLVPPLPLPEVGGGDPVDDPAVRLYFRAAANIGVSVTADELAAVVAVCRAVDGLPLAIELVAAQTRVQSVTELAAALHDRLPALASRTRDTPDRQRTMESAIAWSLERLKPEQQRAFGRLAVFSGGFDVPGAAAVLERDRGATLDLLAALLDASLLVRRPPAAGQARFRMLEPLRDVARARVDAVELESSRQRHADLMAALAERLCPAASGCRRPEDFAQLGLEHPNLMAAISHLAAVDAAACMSMIIGLEPYWWIAGHDGEVRRMAGELLAAGSLSDRDTCVALAYSAAFGGRIRGEPFDVDQASEMLHRAGRLADLLGDDAVTAHVRLAEADLALIRGDDAAQLRAVRSAMEHARRARDEVRLLRALIRYVGDKAWLDEALQIAGRVPIWQGIVLAGLQSWYLEHGADPEMAARYGRQALEFTERWGTPDLGAVLRGTFGLAVLRMGQLDLGQRSLLAALHVLDRSGRRMMSMYPLSSLAELEVARGRWRNGVILRTAARSIASTIGYEGFATASEPVAEERMRTAEVRLGTTAAAEARAAGEQMTYREAVDFALEINGVTRR